MGVDILIILLIPRDSTCISSFFCSSIPTSLFICKRFFHSCFIIESVDSISRDEPDSP